MRIRFSIIVPTHNRYRLLEECVASVVSQSYTNWELIIVDDGSTDETASLVFSDPRIAIIHQEKSERSEARNLGIANAEGQFILFLDDDDYVLEEHLETFDKAITLNGTEQIYRSGYIRCDEMQGHKIEAPNYDQSKHKNPVRYAAFEMCGVWSLCIPAQFLTQKSFPVGFPHWQDTHLILRLFAKHRVKQIKAHTYVYRVHPKMGSRIEYSPGSLVGRAHLNVAAIKDLFQKYGELMRPFLPQDTEQYLCAEKYLEYAQRARLLGYRGESIQLFALVPFKFRMRLKEGVVRYWWYGFVTILKGN